MHPVGLTTSSRMLGAAVVLATMIAVIFVCGRGIRRHSMAGMYKFIGAYNLVLLCAFLFGLLRDDGYGWAFLPTMGLTLPWSFFVPEIVTSIPGGWFPASPTGGLLVNFGIFVVVCGGFNDVLLFFVIRRLFYGSETADHRLL